MDFDSAVSRFTVTQAALSNISVIVTDTEIQSVLIYDYVALYLKENIIEGALLTLFFALCLAGLFTVLAGVAVYVLFLKGIKQRANTAMFIAVTALWLSTTTYWIMTLVATANIYSTLLDQVSRNMDRIARLDDCVSSLQAQGTTNTAVLCSSEGPATFPLGLGTTNRPEVYQLQDCTGTAALTVNVIVADLIVWWRALVLWPNHRVVRLVCAVMITLALVPN
ncbi:hypothetical protein L227DRAFT_616697 [Lentinus tigrinus ALCF2SS1-6]|uniref:Uncharacterized protein n=1 Tax=Lentinus tigrinus ALCF2SS1-6 TaxID=1328759 RepID=A0A5C2RRN1_9APHY|nr:hypothetical protein L227DRAFT_616697 [Lentinus tigrinus ALCF2SS1-6]